jgi:hypothetical protein
MDKHKVEKLLIIFCCILMALIAISISNICVAGKFRHPGHVLMAKLITQIIFETTYFVKHAHKTINLFFMILAF